MAPSIIRFTIPLMGISLLVTTGCSLDGSDRPPTPVHWQDPVEVATGEAYQGPWRMNESDFRYVDAPTVAMDETGRVGVAWVNQEAKDVYFQLRDASGRPLTEDPVNVSRSPDTFSWLPRMVMTEGDDGHVYLLWQEIEFSGGSHGGETFFARSVDGGRSFSEPQNLSRTPAGAGKGRLSTHRWDNGSHDLARGPDGTLYAAWTEYEGALRLSRSTDDGRTFSDPLHVAGSATQPARGPTLAVNPRGRVHLAWTVGEDPAADLRLATSGDRGSSFGDSRIPFETDGHSDAPALAAGSDGTLHLAYGESPDGPFGPSHVRYARSSDGGDTFEAPRRISGGPDDDAPGAGFPSLAVDGEGSPLLAWHVFPEAGSRPVGMGFAAGRDGGNSFSSPSLVPGTANPEAGFNSSLQGLLMRTLAAAPEGSGHRTIAVVHGSFRPDHESRIRLFLGEPRPPDAGR